MSQIAHPINATRPQSSSGGLISKLNGEWHEKALFAYMAVVIFHWGEHIVQAIQIWVLGWERPASKGMLGYVWPVLVTSEWLHYVYALFMLAGLIVLRHGFVGKARQWWTIALVIQFWHHIEHFLLLAQALFHRNLFGSKVPTSIVQAAFPTMRVELHLFYNAVVFVPMIIAMYYHLRPPAGEPAATCVCGQKAARRSTSAA